MRHLLYLSLFFFSLAGCSTQYTSLSPIGAFKPSLTHSQEHAREALVGVWYGSQPTKDGGIRQWIVERNQDGTYKIKFRLKNSSSEKHVDQTEIGYWGISGPIYFTIFRGRIDDNGEISHTNPADPYNYDAYEVISLSESEMEYQSFGYKDIYKIQKVKIDFTFPNEN